MWFYIFQGIISLLTKRRPRRQIQYSPFDFIDFANMEDAVKYVLHTKRIKTREDLDEWCGGRDRLPLYSEVKMVTRIIWSKEADPKRRVRRIYESLLPGYTNARVTI